MPSAVDRRMWSSRRCAWTLAVGIVLFLAGTALAGAWIRVPQVRVLAVGADGRLQVDPDSLPAGHRYAILVQGRERRPAVFAEDCGWFLAQPLASDEQLIAILPDLSLWQLLGRQVGR